MVHVYFGYLTADEGRITPALTNYPPGLTVGQMNGESGRYWESQFIGAITKAYHQPSDPLGLAQAGTLYLCERDDRGFELSQAWVKACIAGSMYLPKRTSEAWIICHHPVVTNRLPPHRLFHAHSREQRAQIKRR